MKWLRTERTPLIALVICAIAVVAAYVWLSILPSLKEERSVVLASAGKVDIAGQTLTMGPAEWREFDSPAGSRTLSIRLTASGGSDAEQCGQITLTEEESSRVWVSSRSGLDVPYDDSKSSCSAEEGTHRVMMVFLLPDDATGPFFLDIDGSDRDRARFFIEP